MPICPSLTNPFTDKLIPILKRHPKRIVFPEGEDIRVIRVASRLVQEEVIVPILLGNQEKIKSLAEAAGVKLRFVRIIDPKSSSDLPLFCERYIRIEKLRGIEVMDAREVMMRPHFFASMMVQYGQADAMVAGNSVDFSTVYRAATRMIKPLPDVPVFGLMCGVVPEYEKYGKDGIIFMADVAMLADPSVEDLAKMAVSVAKTARHLKGTPVSVAMLSASTRGSKPTASAKKMQAATTLALQYVDESSLSEDVSILGEIQIDAAIDPKAFDIRLGNSSPKELGLWSRPADVWIFPNLDASDISVKLLGLMPGANLYGMFLAGLALPVVQVTRQSCEERIYGSALVAGIEAIKFHDLHPQGMAEVY